MTDDYVCFANVYEKLQNYNIKQTKIIYEYICIYTDIEALRYIWKLGSYFSL